MFDVRTMPYKDETGSGYVCDIADGLTGQQWRVTGPSERDALLRAKDILDNAPKDNCQCVESGSQLVIPA